MRGLPRIYNSDLLQKDILCFYMVMMSVQIIALEGMTISPLKAGAMALSFPILFCLLTRSRRDITVLFLACSYWIVLICCSLMSSSVVSWDRIIYRAMFLSTFVCHYHIVRSEAVDISFVRKLFAVIICAYGVSFVLQCFFFIIGVRGLLLINLSGAMTFGGGIKANCLAIEPSHAARIMAFVYWGYIYLTEIVNGREMTIIEHYKKNPYVTVSFWLTMLFMGSSTAVLGAAIVGIHFCKKRLEIYLFAVIACIVLMNIDFHIETVDRLKKVIEAFLSEDTVDTLKNTESSGGSRIAPIINTFTQTDITSLQTWIGIGSDNVRTQAALWTTQRIGDINDFGLITYICSLILVFKCCIRRFFCLETLLFAVLLGFAIGSLYTCWCGMMVFTAIKHYEHLYKKKHIKASL